MIDRIYIAASALDARYTRICVASVRYFYPEIPIHLLASGSLQRGLADELRRYWNVPLAAIPKGDYGWGFIKLEPLFGPPGERFLVIDSDTVLTGPVIDIWREGEASFLVDEETQTEADTKRLYYNWEKLNSTDPAAHAPRFVFNSGQWFGTAGVLTRADFDRWIEWTMPRRLRHPEVFMPGDQGVLNYVLNQKAAYEGLRVDRRQIMRWPGHSLDGLNAESVSNGTAEPRVIHWAGVKKARQRDMVGADLLAFFEKQYYKRFPAGRPRRVFAGCHHSLSCHVHDLQVTMRLTSRRLTAAVAASRSPRGAPLATEPKA